MENNQAKKRLTKPPGRPPNRGVYQGMMLYLNLAHISLIWWAGGYREVPLMSTESLAHLCVTLHELESVEVFD